MTTQHPSKQAALPTDQVPDLPEFPFLSTRSNIGLYPCIDSLLWLTRLLDAGVSFIQLRIKEPKSNQELEETFQAAIELAKRHQAILFINDFWQIAIKYGAYGVHLGQEDLLDADLVAIQKAGLRLGISTHDEQELFAAMKIQPSYLALGHIFPTQTKVMPSKPQGLIQLKQQVELAKPYPTVAIGGIGLAEIPDVLATGVNGIALVSAITKSDNWLDRTKTLLSLVEGKQS